VDLKETRMEPNPCLNCGTVLDAATSVNKENDLVPYEGAISICFNCGHIMAFGKDLKFRELNDEEIKDIAGDKTLIAAQKARAAVLNKKKK
jgi:hypothetical protein